MIIYLIKSQQSDQNLQNMYKMKAKALQELALIFKLLIIMIKIRDLQPVTE